MFLRSRSPALLLLAAAVSSVSGGALPDAASAQAGPILEEVPDSIDPGASYLIYLHGAIIETAGRRPTSPAFGVYEYDRILEAFAGRGYHVISEARPAGTRVDAYAEKVAGQLRRLVAAGVPPGRIAVVGFSKGGMITIAASSRTGIGELRYVILAGCTSSILERDELALTGRILSIHEATDGIGRSCTPLFRRSPEARETKELRIETGDRHGAFYRPRSEWMEPLLGWLAAPAPPGVP